MYHEVSVEPNLQPITGETFNGASSITFESCLELSSQFNNVFNPQAPSNRGTNIASTYRKHERIKKNAYEQRVLQVEHASFTPLVFSATGNEANAFYKRLASVLASKRDDSYSSTLAWLRCRLSFSLLRSSIRCIRGALSRQGLAIKSLPVDLVRAETDIPVSWIKLCVQNNIMILL